MNDTLTLRAATSRAVSIARHTLAEHLERWGCRRAPDSLLVFSELVTNALKHAGGATRVDIAHGGQTLRFEVHDESPDPPAIRDPSTAPGGFGLRLVERLSQSWGWERTASGKVVWSTIDCSAENL
jgi:two-component sensor histidine kinase